MDVDYRGGNSELEGQIPRMRGGAADARLRHVRIAGPLRERDTLKNQIFVIRAQ